MDTKTQQPILIAGPTASGKSALALALAERCSGVVINADSMQVYRELPILTAQPSADEQARAPHRLYGHVAASVAYSTGRYLDDIARVLTDARAAGQHPIIVGGTGLYFLALLEGLSPVPPIPDAVRDQCRALAAEAAPGELHARLAARDPVMAARLNPADSQRLTRALEVIEATGQSLAVWQQQQGTPLIDAEHAIKIRIDRSREDLAQRCDLRFDLMMAAGALDEVRALAKQHLSDDLPAMRALGVRPLLGHIAGNMTRAAAVEQSKLETRQYVKRQQTWLKRHMVAWKSINAQQMENIEALSASIV